MTSRLFVFGSYSEGMIHWARIAPFVDKIVPASIQGSVWRLKAGFPVVLREGGNRIQGHCVDIRGSEILWGLLDEFHGHSSLNPSVGLHQRCEIEAICNATGQALPAMAYFLNPTKLPKTAVLLADGDWQLSMEKQPPLIGSLSDRQKEYLRKLAAASGREIVPINDMSLYRELMNLELIVDKGRRLALSRFGQEVVRYLD